MLSRTVMIRRVVFLSVFGLLSFAGGTVCSVPPNGEQAQAGISPAGGIENAAPADAGVPPAACDLPALAVRATAGTPGEACREQYRAITFVQEHGGGVVLDYEHLEAIAFNEQHTVIVAEYKTYLAVIEGQRLERLHWLLQARCTGLVEASPLDDAGHRVEPGDVGRPVITRVRVVTSGTYHFSPETGEYVADEQ